MGFFTGLLTLPLAPVRGVVWIGEQVMEELERELYDEESIRRELVQLELEFEDGLIDEEERQVREDALLERMAISASSPEETDG
jgi:gas vesicle protein GvpG